MRKDAGSAAVIRLGWEVGVVPPPDVTVSGVSTRLEILTNRERFKLVRVLMTRALAGKSPFEALAHGGCEISHPQRR